MTVSREELAAFTDGELEPVRAREVAAIVAADPALVEEVRRHRALRERLGTHFAGILEAPVPERLIAPLKSGAEPINLAAVRRQRMQKAERWSWFVGPAIAASLALAVFVPRGGGYVHGTLESSLQSQLVAQQSGQEPTRILLSFRDKAGDYCRAFTGRSRSGIACRDATGWRLRMTAHGVAGSAGEYQMAGSPAAEVLEKAQSMAVGPALDAARERQAQAQGWR